MKRRTPAAGGSDPNGPKHLAPMETDVFSKLFNLVAHCAVNRYDDGEPRKPGWFTIQTNGAGWVVKVKEPDTALSFSCTADTLDNALAMADLLLGTEDAPWEPDPFLRQQAKKVNK